MYYHVYRIDNIENGKMYYGYTNVDPKSFTFEQLVEFAQNKADLKHLYNSMKKYGEEAFSVTQVGFYSSEADALRQEITLMLRNETDMASKGYNYRGAELIPCQTITEKEPVTVADMYYVYGLRNTLNGKTYYGYCDKDPRNFTWAELLEMAENTKELRHLYNSMKKYGSDAFVLVVIKKCNSKADAKELFASCVDEERTRDSEFGYNNDNVQLIGSAVTTENTFSVEPIEKDPADVISAAAESLFVLRNCIRTKNFEKFFSEYVYFNSIIPVTGVYDHFGLALDGMMVTLFEICRDCLSVYIREHLKIR